MAKKKSKRVVSTQGKTQSSTVVNITVGDGKGLSVYTPYISTPNFTFFFERPSTEFDRSSLQLPHMFALKNGFSLVTDGSKLVGIEFAKQISQLFINYLNAESISKHTCRKIAIGAQYFIRFIAEKYIACQCIEDLDFHMLHEAVKSQTHDNGTSVKLFLVKVLSRHPFTKTLGGNPSDIPLPQKKKLSIEDEDFDSLTDEINYSDREMCQILTYCVYEIERMRSQLNAINAVTKETLGDDFVGFEKTVRGIKGVTAKVIQFFKNKNYEAIYQNMLYSAQCERTGMAVAAFFKVVVA